MQLNRYITITITGYNKKVYHTSSELTYYADSQTGKLTYYNGPGSNVNNDFGITAGSLRLEEVLCDGEFSLNQLCATKFEVQCFNLYRDLNGHEITVTCTENNVVRPIFKGIIDSSSTDNFNDFRDIVAYDRLYTLRDTNVGEWWDTFWENRPQHTAVAIPIGSPIENNYYELVSGSYVASTDTAIVEGKTYYYNVPIATIGEVRTALCAEVNLECETTTLVNDDIQIKKYMTSTTKTATQVTFGELMSMICEINGVIGHIGRDGVFKFVTISTTEKTLGAYEKVNVDFKDYETALITGINVYESAKNLMLPYGDNTNCYNIVGNIFTLALDNYEILRTMCSRILSKISMIKYIPCSIPMVVSDLTLNVGDKIVSDRGTHYILSQVYSGSLFVEQTIDCPSYGEILSQEVQDINNTIVANQRYSSISQDQDLIKSEVSRVSSDMSGITAQISTIAQTAEGLEARVARSEVDIESNSERMTTYETTVSINADGVRIAQGAEGTYTQFTDTDIDFYVQGVKNTTVRSDGLTSEEVMIGGPDDNQKWHIHMANNGYTLMFLRR